MEVGQELELPVESVRPYGVMLKLREGLTALLHRDEFGGNKLDADPLTSFTVGEQVQVRCPDPTNLSVHASVRTGHVTGIYLHK